VVLSKQGIRATVELSKRERLHLFVQALEAGAALYDQAEEESRQKKKKRKEEHPMYGHCLRLHLLHG